MQLPSNEVLKLMQEHGIPDTELICSWAELDEECSRHWEQQIRSSRIPSLFTGRSRGLDSLEECDSRDIRERIIRDPLLAAKLLSVANSTSVGKLNPVGSVDKAISLLGLDLVLAVVLTYELENEQHKSSAISRELLLYIRNMASISSALAALIAAELRLPDADAFRNAALTSCVASLLLAQSPQFNIDNYLAFPDEQQRLLHEEELWGCCSPVVAQRMLTIWGLQQPVPILAGYRHMPVLGRLDPELPPMQARQICLIAAINALAQAYIKQQSITPEILFNRRNYRTLKQNLLEQAAYGPLGRCWGLRSTEHLLRAAY